MIEPNAYAALLGELSVRLGAARDGRVLALPELVIGLAPSDLAFAPDSTDAREAARREEHFALLVNQIPSEGAGFHFDGRVVWDIYERVLEGKRLGAASGGTAVAFEEAQTILRLAARMSLAGGGTYYATGVLPPHDLEQDGNWTRVRLDTPDLTLAGAALGADLQAWITARGLDTEAAEAGLEITAVSIEIFVLRLARPWLRDAIFSDRGWTWDGGLLSDGGTPPTGLLPSYIAGLVLARDLNVELTLKRNVGVRPVRRFRRRRSQTVRFRDAGESADDAFDPAFPVPARYDAAQALAALNAQAGQLRARRNALLRDHRPGASPATAAARRRRLDAALRSVDERVRDLDELATTAPDPRHIFVLAAIRQSLPRCPDPDPTLF